MTTANLALHLAANTHHIARLEQAGTCYTDIQTAIDAIERLINRPVPDRVLGPCPTLREHGPCDTALTAARHDVETQCPTCKTIHNIDRLWQQQLDRTDDMSFTLAELYKTILPAVNEYIPLRTLQHWAASSRLVPTGYNQEAEPRYQLAHVRKLRDAKPQKTPTGAGAHKTKASSQ